MKSVQPILPLGSVVNRCEILGVIDNTHYRMMCPYCEREFSGKIWHVNKRMVKSCGCLKIRIHSLIMQQAFHNYRGKKNGKRDGGIPVSQT